MGSYKEQQKEKLPKVRLLYDEGLSVGRISKILSMPRQTVYRWIANFAEEKGNTMSAKKEYKKKAIGGTQEVEELAIQSKSPKTDAQLPSSDELESAEEKIARLEKELREARLRADFYDEMINVAEKKFGIQIRKKAGARR